MLATGFASLKLTFCWAAFSAAAGSKVGLAAGAETEGAMEPKTFPAPKNREIWGSNDNIVR